MVQCISVQLFGRPVILDADGLPSPLESRKALALLAYLVRQQRPPARRSLAALFWGDLPEARGRRNLSRELTLLTTLFPGSFAADYQSVGWIGDVPIDVSAAEALLRPQPGGPSPAALAAAVALYRGPYLEGFALDNCAEFESWLLREREFWQQRITDALGRLIALSVEQGEPAQAQQYARRWIELEPWQEDAHRALMLLLARSGQRGAALAQFELCRRTLAHELDIEPSRELITLAEQIRAGALEPAAQRHPDDPPPAVAASEAPSGPLPPPAEGLSAQHWSPVPSLGKLFGRDAELAALRQLVEEQRCRAVAVLGMGGIGKTALVARAARELAPCFEQVLWRSLVNAPPLPELLRACFKALAVPPLTIPEPLDDQLALLLECLRRRRCLLVLDNLESLLQQGTQSGQFRPGLEAYGQLLQLVGSYEHQSCLLLTSRELPPPFVQLGAATPLVKTLPLAGLDGAAGEALLAARGLAEDNRAREVVARYSGNPLALALAAELVHELYGGDLAAFLGAETIFFDDIRAVLDQQWQRLSPLEQDLLLWLGVCRTPQSAASLAALLTPPAPTTSVLDALRSLRRRSLVEAFGAQFGLQNVVLEYLTAHLIGAVCAELAQGDWRRFQSHGLMQTQTLEYVRQSQIRLLLGPTARQLLATFGPAGLRETLLAGLHATRSAGAPTPGYAAGNALNLLLHLGIDLRKADFSRLSIWQADLRRARLHDVSFAHADLRGSLFAEILRDAFALAWSPDGKLLAACSGHGELRLWRTSDWQLVGCCSGPSTFVWHLAFSPDGERLASCDDEGVVRIWDVASCQALYALRSHQRAVQALDWSPDGRMVISGGRDHVARIWDVTQAVLLHELHGHGERIRWAAWSPDGALVATASFDHTVRLWDPRTGHELATLNHPAPVQAVAWHPGGRLLATSCADHHKRVWDVATVAVVHSLASTPGLAFQLIYRPDGVQIAGSGVNGVFVWQSGSGELERSLLGHSHSIAGIAWSPDGRRLAARSETSIWVWELANEQILTVLKGVSHYVYQFALSPDERLIATGHMDELVRVWDRAGRTVLYTLEGHTNAIVGLSFSADGRTLATADYDGTLRIWDAGRGALLRTMQTGSTRIISLARSADGALLATGCHNGTVWIWDWRQSRACTVLHGHTLPVTGVAFAPDGQHLFSSSEERTLVCWDLEREQEAYRLPIEGRCAYDLEFDAAGATLYGACNDALLRAWDLGSRELVWRLEAPAAITRLERSPDGSKLLTRGDGVVCLWDAATGAQLLILRHERGFGPARFADEGRSFITSSQDGTLHCWDTETGALREALPTPGSYAQLDITGITGVSEVQREALRSLGAVESVHEQIIGWYNPLGEA